MHRSPSVTHVEVINAFLEGTTCRNLVHELVRSRPANTNELFDAATNYAAGEEAVGAIFDDKPSKRKEDAPAEGGNAKINAPAKKAGEEREEAGPTNPAWTEAGRRLRRGLRRRPGPQRTSRPPSRLWRPVRRHAQEAVSLPQGLRQPHPRVVRDAPEVLQPRHASRRGQEEGCWRRPILTVNYRAKVEHQKE